MKKFLSQIKLRIMILIGKVSLIKKDVDYNYIWYGSDYGGFFVYPDILNNESIIYSFGVGEDISFEKDIIKDHQCRVYSFDPTPKSINWVKKQQLPTGLRFFEYGLDSKTSYVDFNLPKNKDYISGSIAKHLNVDINDKILVQVKCLSDITKELEHNHIDVLKIDIEGSEYEVIDSILSSQIEIKQILVELHERFFPDGKSKTTEFLKKMKDYGYNIFAVSDSMMEVSFIKK